MFDSVPIAFIESVNEDGTIVSNLGCAIELIIKDQTDWHNPIMSKIKESNVQKEFSVNN